MTAKVFTFLTSNRTAPIFRHFSRHIENIDLLRGPLYGLDFSSGPDGTSRKIAEKLIEERLANRAAKGKAPRLKLWQFERVQNRANRLMKLIEARDYTHGMIWNGLKGRGLLVAETCKAMGIQTIYGELGPIKDRVAFDAKGVNYFNSVPRDPAFYSDWAAKAGHKSDEWRSMGDGLKGRKNRSGTAMDRGFDAGENYLFVPLQVPYDSQIVTFGSWVGSMQNFCKMLGRASDHLPAGWHLKLKEHPSSKIRLDDVLAPLETERFRICNDMDTFEMIRHAQGVVSLNSSVALQSFYFDKPVLTCGQAFFAFEPLVKTATNETELTQALADPESIVFDKDVRAAFMNYLTFDYFFEGSNNHKAPDIAPHEISRFAERFGLTMK